MVVYLGANCVFNHDIFTSPLPNWIFVGPLLFILQGGIFISLHGIPCKELPDEEDWKKMQDNYWMLISSLFGFFSWFFALIILSMIPVSMNVNVSILCGFGVIFLEYYLVRTRENRWNIPGIT
ncbi:MAG TPA: hypothetical protein PKM50_09775 [Methanoregula sp.]|nr:hypothetical protein [Methanoregula sp.]